MGGFLRAVYIVWWRDVIRYGRDRVRLAASLAQPLLYLVIFGSGLSASLGAGFAGASGMSYTQFMYPGIISMAILFTSIFAAMGIVWDREFGFLKELLVAPIERSAIAVGKALGGATQAIFQGAILLVLAPLVGVSLTVTSALLLLGFMAALAFGLSAMGVAIAARMRSMQGFQMVMNFLMMPMFFLSGALFPLVGLPGWMTVLTRLDPASYGIDPIRRTLLGEPAERLALTIGDQPVPILAEVGVMLVFGIVMLAIAARSFQQRD
ncbi:MAG: ABC transporter permease [Chloroflexi bacterium]|nr:ABC transporter permease [Chloroflexota bacterium]